MLEEQVRTYLESRGVSVHAWVDPGVEGQWVRVLVETSKDVQGLSSALRTRFGRPFTVVERGDALAVARRLLHFLGEDLRFAVRDALGVVVYVTNDPTVLKRAHGTRHVNVETFRRFANGDLAIVPASAAYREQLRSHFRVRARGFPGFPADNLDELLTKQFGVVTREDLRAAREASDEDFSWTIHPEGPKRGSYDFVLGFGGRRSDEVHALVKSRLEGVAGSFGLTVHEQDPLGYGRKYYLYGDLGAVTLVFYHSDRQRRLSYVVPEKPALEVPSELLLPTLLAALRAQVA